MGRKLADRHNFKLGDRIPVQGDIYPVNIEFAVRGIYESKADNENLIFHNDYLMEALDGAYGDTVSTFVVLVERPEETTRVAQSIDAMFRNSTMPTKTATEKAFVVSFMAYLGNVKLFLLSVCSAITFTILLVSGNTMAMKVRERVR